MWLQAPNKAAQLRYFIICKYEVAFAHLNFNLYFTTQRVVPNYSKFITYKKEASELTSQD
jgi:hypothetical protein